MCFAFALSVVQLHLNVGDVGGAVTVDRASKSTKSFRYSFRLEEWIPREKLHFVATGKQNGKSDSLIYESLFFFIKGNNKFCFNGLSFQRIIFI